jgi:predicted NBD/HSP70 family sugar kinase
VGEITRKPPRGAPPLMGIGLAIAGQYDRNTGTSLTYPRVGNWRNVPVREEVAAWVRAPVDVIGYMHGLALGERRHQPSSARDLLCVDVEENVAMGVIANGKVLEGCTGNAGELGHVTIEPSGPLCHCGNQGCLEMLATCQAVEQRARSSAALNDLFEDPGAVTYDRIVEMARAGHPFGARLLRQAASALGIGLATAVNLFNPERIVMSGRFFEAGDLVLGPLWDTVQTRAVPNSARRVKLARSELEGRGPALGAGWLAIGQVLKRV